MYSCKSIIILNEIISLCRTQQELNTLNMLINHSLLLHWRPRKLISEFCIHLPENWKPDSLNSLTMGSEDTSSQEQQCEAKWKQQRRKLCFCAHCKGFHVRRKYIRCIHMIKWGPSIASDDSSQDAPRILGTPTSVSKHVPRTSSTCGEPWYRQDLQGANTPQKVKVQDLPTSSRFENGCCKLRSRVTILIREVNRTWIIRVWRFVVVCSNWGL